MPQSQSETGENTYSTNVTRGFYQTPTGGLHGKLDNIRRYWEDHLTRLFIRPHLRTLPHTGLRIVDLGAGAGQGFDLLTRIEDHDISFEDMNRYIITADDIALYLGMDLSEAMIRQGSENYADRDNMRFVVGDLREGLASIRDNAPFHLYYSSYGSFSHLSYAHLQNLLAEIGDHAENGALVVMDMVGRYSMEWPLYWGAATEAEKVRDYSTSYLYTEEQRNHMDSDAFKLRFWTGDEIHQVCREVSTAQVRLVPVDLMDRSVMVGRHIDTGDYGAKLPPIRQRTASLHEDYLRTPLHDLMVTYEPEPGFPALNAFYGELCAAWNTLVEFTLRRLAGERLNLIEIVGWEAFHPALQMSIMNMDRVVDSVAWMRFGDARANIIEPQLGYTLRTLENALQSGKGCGHGLLAVLRVEK